MLEPDPFVLQCNFEHFLPFFFAMQQESVLTRGIFKEQLDDDEVGGADLENAEP